MGPEVSFNRERHVVSLCSHNDMIASKAARLAVCYLMNLIAAGEDCQRHGNDSNITRVDNA